MIRTPLTQQLGIEAPILCGAMFPCSNVELIAAVSEAGGIGIVQPLSLVYVYQKDFRAALKEIRNLTAKPIGMNVIVEKGSRLYEARMREWVEIALEEGVRFFVTALGNPAWVVAAAKPRGAIVYHNATERKWAEKALLCGVDGLNCVNNRAGGHAGTQSPEDLFNELSPLGVPLVCAGGIGDESAFVQAMQLGYAGVQMGTRFIATTECASHLSYKNAIITANETDIVLTERVTGVPLSVISTPFLKKIGTQASPLAKTLLKHPRTKNWVRLFYTLQSAWKLKRSSLQGLSSKDYWQAGRSVGGIHSIESTASIISRFTKALELRSRNE